MTTALSELSDYITTEDPFDAVLGFSQGAALAATLLARPTSTTPPFRLAIFICGAIPGDSSALRGGNLRALDPLSDAGAIKIPTAHILGKKDPVRHESVVLRDVCDEKGKRVFEFEGGHEVPRGRDSKEMVAVIRDVLDGVMFAQ
jgi:predicted esterase